MRPKRWLTGLAILGAFSVASCLAQQSAPIAVQTRGVKITFANPPDAPPSPAGDWGLSSDTRRIATINPNGNGPFADLIAHRISSVRVTWSDPERFRTNAQVEDLLRQLLTSPHTRTYSFHIWQFPDGVPSVVAEVRDSVGRKGKWIVWTPEPALYWAYLDRGGNLWWADWDWQTPLPRSAGTDTSETDGLIQAFAASHDPWDLRKALDAVTFISLGKPCPGDGKPCPQKRIEPDAAIATVWLKLFAAIDAAEAELAQKLKPVYTQVSPPGEDGVRSGGEVPPSEIKDPALRKQYEEAIAANERNRLASIEYAKVRSMRMLAESYFWVWAGPRYRGNLGARNSMVKEAAALGCSKERIDKISAIVGAMDPAPPSDDSSPVKPLQ